MSRQESIAPIGVRCLRSRVCAPAAIAAFLLCEIALCTPALSSDVPFNKFTQWTLSELIANAAADVGNEKMPLGSTVIDADLLRAKVRVTFVGSSRPIGADEKRYIGYYSKTAAEDPAKYSALFQHDYLFKENGVGYWLPVEEGVAGYFSKELKPGDTVDLYLIRAGGTLTRSGWLWVLLVEGFKSPQD